MDCCNFQDSLSDYLDGALDSRGRAECAAHRLACRECRELHNDVRATVTTLGALGEQFAPEPAGLQARILAATTAGEMLSCTTFDQLIERYFDGVLLAPDFQTFQAHFEQCAKCHRLMGGIEEAIALCRDAREEVEVPASLHQRIVAATSGVNANWRGHLQQACAWLWGQVNTPQWAVAALIFAASALLITLRFGSVEGMAGQANAQAERLVFEINQTGAVAGALARTGFSKVSYQFGNYWPAERKTGELSRPARPQVSPSVRLQPVSNLNEQRPADEQPPPRRQPAQ